MRTGRRRRPQDAAVTLTAKHKTKLSINQTFCGKQCDRRAIRPSLSGRGHEKTRSEIDWNRIMTPDGNGQAPPDDDDDDGGDSPGLSSVRRTVKKKKPDKMHVRIFGHPKKTGLASRPLARSLSRSCRGQGDQGGGVGSAAIEARKRLRSVCVSVSLPRTKTHRGPDG